MNLKKYLYYLHSIGYLLNEFHNPLQILWIFAQPSKAIERTVRLKKSGLRFRVRTAMDVWSIKETFIDEFYTLFGTLVQDNWTIIDIGAGIGEFCIYAAHGHPNNRIYAFEPFEGSFKLLQDNLALNRCENIEPVHKAISDSNRPMTIQRPTSQPLQFITTPEKNVSSENPRIEAITLEQVFSLYHIEQCDLLKLDCEGCEYAILLHTPDTVLQSIRRIVLEYHDGVTSFNHVDLVKFLIQKGFLVRLQPNYVHSNLGYLYASRS